VLNRRVTLTAIFGTLAICVFSTHSALRLHPASIVVKEPSNVFFLGKAIQRLGPARVRFETVELYSGERVAELAEASEDQIEPPENQGSDSEQAKRQFDVRVGPGTDVKVGKTYLIGITRFLKSRFPQPKWRVDPEGYRLVDIPVVGSALFTRSPDLKFLLTAPPDTSVSAPRKILNPILRLLRADPIANRRVASLELFFEPQLGGKLTQVEIHDLQSIIEDESEDAVVRDYLLQACDRLHVVGESDWVAGSVRTVLRRAPLQVELGSTVASFQHTALLVLKRRGGPEDVSLAARMLPSASPGVTLSALQTMEALDAQQALIEARSALEIPELPQQSKKYLASFVLRAEAKKASGTDR